VLILAVICGLAAVAYCGQITPSSDWKNSIEIPDDPFEFRDLAAKSLGWIKFTILTEPFDPNLVYFQDSKKYTLHYDFASERIDPFLGMSPEDFEQVTLHAQGQQAILGTVITPPMLPRRSQMDPIVPVAYEYGIQFVRSDPYSREEIVEMFEVVRSSIDVDPNYQALYLPTYEQQSVAEANRDWLLQQGIIVGSPRRWITSNVCYSSGWTLGRLKYVATDEIETAYATGQLKPGDVLLTDAIPAEVPVVAGIVSLSPSTPNSHVAILAKTYSIPFAYLAFDEDVEQAQQLVGKQIVLSAYEDREVTKVRLVNVDGVLSEQQKEELLALKEPPVLSIVAAEHYGAYSAAVDDLGIGDIRYFGGKAANYSILREAIGGNCRIAAAFSFDLWNDFLDQQLYAGTTLRQFIRERLDGFTYPPADMASVLHELNAIRDVIRDPDMVQFTATMQQAVIDTLTDPRYGFDGYRKIRFRSSTNVEDSEHFTGAGLYDSYSGCLADDLDGDNEGPSQCDPDRNGERGVFRAIRRVFASFYNDNAYLERLRHGINEGEVGMALLVHHSFPDEIELANGVATLEKSDTGPVAHLTEMTLVTQEGAFSVANPDPGIIPEEVTASRWQPTDPIVPRLRRGSNLVPLGSTVMEWTADYVQLAELLLDAAAEFERITGKSEYILDFEYKKVSTGEGLVVKQIREIPRSPQGGQMTSMLINEPTCFCLYQGEYGDVFAYHRLKSVWKMQTHSLWLTKENLGRSILSHVDIEYLAAGRIRSVGGTPEFWPYGSHRLENTGPGRANVSDIWLMHHLANPRRMEFQMEGVPTEVSGAESPVVTLRDFVWYGWPHVTLRVEYDEPEPVYDYHSSRHLSTGRSDRMTIRLDTRRRW
jgi:hypothetical protein